MYMDAPQHLFFNDNFQFRRFVDATEMLVILINLIKKPSKDFENITSE